MALPKEVLVFDQNAVEYDRWYDENPHLYQSELKALQEAIPINAKGIEIGIGTGRFAGPLNIQYGVEPAESMAEVAASRGLTVYNGYAEALPLNAETFDFALMATTVCFLSDAPKAFSEVYRILKPKGIFIVGLLDKNSWLGQQIQVHKNDDKFYQAAHLHSIEEIQTHLNDTGFSPLAYWQTLFNPEQVTTEEPLNGYGKGGFVVIKAQKEIFND